MQRQRRLRQAFRKQKRLDSLWEQNRLLQGRWVNAPCYCTTKGTCMSGTAVHACGRQVCHVLCIVSAERLLQCDGVRQCSLWLIHHTTAPLRLLHFLTLLLLSFVIWTLWAQGRQRFKVLKVTQNARPPRVFASGEDSVVPGEWDLQLTCPHSIVWLGCTLIEDGQMAHPAHRLLWAVWGRSPMYMNERVCSGPVCSQVCLSPD